jgi:hypothetical protein
MAEFNLWLLIVGIAAGAAVMWLVIGTLARNDDEESAEERQLEAGWIAETIEQHGGRAPVTLVEQILALHRRYLQGGPGIPVPQGEPDATQPETGSERGDAVAEPAAVDAGSAAPGHSRSVVRGSEEPPEPARSRTRGTRASSETTEAKAR